jgi:hypothetical protein
VIKLDTSTCLSATIYCQKAPTNRQQFSAIFTGREKAACEASHDGKKATESCVLAVYACIGLCSEPRAIALTLSYPCYHPA